MSNPKPTFVLPQIRIITQYEFDMANLELKRDNPGNPGQTLEEYVNMVVEEIWGEGRTIMDIRLVVSGGREEEKITISIHYLDHGNI